MASKNIVRCGFSGCNRFFSSEKELVRHKVRDPDHEYCPRCNLDFDTEEEMFIHLITSPKHRKSTGVHSPKIFTHDVQMLAHTARKNLKVRVDSLYIFARYRTNNKSLSAR